MQTLSEMLVSDFMPHGHCYFWRPDILWTHVLSDAGIAVAYFCIPAILLYFLFKARPKRIPFWWVIILFAAFIYLCGITHIIGIVTVWTPIYVIEGWLKAATAIISVITALTLIPLIPKALTLKSAAELAEVNAALNNEILERDRVQRELHATVTALKNSNEELEDMTSITAHDLQAPLRRMITFADAIKTKMGSDGENGQEIGKLLGAIEQNGLRMRHQLEALLDFSALSTNEKNLSEVNIQDLIDDIVKELNNGENHTTIEFQIGPMPVLHASQQMLRHVFFNLLDNAIKYRHPDRNLRIEITAKQIKSEQSESVWQFTVMDNGIGFDNSQSHKVFKLFGRLHKDDSIAGSGIGLATVRKILQTNGGDIWVDSKKDEGCKFYFTVPNLVPENANA